MPKWFLRTLAALVLVALLALTIAVTGRKHATDTENALWTFILFAIGIGVSFYFGRQSIKDAASDLVRPQARGAARRLITLGSGIAGVSQLIELHRVAASETAKTAGSVPLQQVTMGYDVLDLYVSRQLETVGDALEDWREFEPKIVNELEELLKQPPRPDSATGGWEFPAVEQ
jgi:hypothetical protein